jgi:hypothetical protein
LVDVRIATREEVMENPGRFRFIAGGWINDSEPDVIYVYWHRHQEHLTMFSLLRILEHEVLHSVLATNFDLETSAKLDLIHDASPVWLGNGKLIFVSRFKFKRRRQSPVHLVQGQSKGQKAEAWLTSDCR